MWEQPQQQHAAAARPWVRVWGRPSGSCVSKIARELTATCWVAKNQSPPSLDARRHRVCLRCVLRQGHGTRVELTRGENGGGEPSAFAPPDLDSFCGLVYSDVQWLAARPDLTPLSTWIAFAPLCEGASLVQLRVVSPRSIRRINYGSSIRRINRAEVGA